MSQSFRDNSGNIIEVFTENEYLANGFIGVLMSISLGGFLLSLIFGGISDVYAYCGNVMLWTFIIVGVITAIANTVSLKKEYHPVVVPLVIGALSTFLQSVIMINIIDNNVPINFFSVFGSIIVALVESTLAVISGLIISLIITLILQCVSKRKE